MQKILKSDPSNLWPALSNPFFRLSKELWSGKGCLPICLMAALLSLSAGTKAETGNSVVDRLIKEYQSEGATEFQISNGKKLWLNNFEHTKAKTARSCSNCHGKDIRQEGQHIRTKRSIEPLAPSINPERLSNEKQIRKWLKRNCKWTLGRECSPQEKGDLLLWIQTQ